MDLTNLEIARTIVVILSMLGIVASLVILFFRVGRFLGRASTDLPAIANRVVEAMEGQRLSQEALVEANNRQAMALEAAARQTTAIETHAEQMRDFGLAMRAMSRRLNAVLDDAPSLTRLTEDLAELRTKVETLRE